MLPTPRHHTLYLLGWQERIALPELHIAELPVKVDTGAKTSALHAENFAEFERGGERWVRFEVALPWPPGAEPTAPLRRAEAPLLDYRQVTSSNGAGELRPVIRTPLELFGERWPIEVTLTGRWHMRFPMLLGREAIAGRALVDASRTYLASARQGGRA